MRKNKGDALLSVIIAMTVVGVLGVLICSIAYSNFNMKYIDKTAKDNFYSAESVLDDVCAKLEEVMSEQYVKAYSSIVENYGIYERDDRQSEMTDDLVAEFIVNMADALSHGRATNAVYSFDNINVFNTVTVGATTTKVFFNASNYPAGADITIESVAANGTARYTLDMYETKESGKVVDSGIILRNVSVTYTYNGFTNNIVTDIRVSAPRVDFTQISAAPDIASYAYIAQAGFVGNASSDVKLKGRAFAGKIDLGLNSEFDATSDKASLVICEGDIKLANFAQFTTGTDTQLWAENITTNKNDWTTTRTVNNQITLAGNTYIRDDISLNGPYGVLTLSGRYYGYGTGNTTDSSAIIINGRHSTVDMSGLTSLMLAGTGYISATSANGSATSNADIMMGESIAVKGNQIAYLVPTECLGTRSNPMSESDYNTLNELADWKTIAINKRITGVGRSLKDFGCDESCIVAEFKTGTNNDKQVYLFIKFNSTVVAAEYFMDFYSGNSQSAEKVKKYLDTYLGTFKFDESTTTRLVTNGNYLVQTSTEKGKYTSVETTTDGYLNEIQNYSDTFSSLCTNLQSSGGTSRSTVYQNVVNSQAVNNLATSVNKTVDGITLVITQGDYTVSSTGKGVIIANGNVVVNGTANWTGVIICNGTLTVMGNSTLASDETIVDRALSIETDIEATPYGYNFLKGSESYGLSGSGSADSQTDIRQCIAFENYVSK